MQKDKSKIFSSQSQRDEAMDATYRDQEAPTNGAEEYVVLRKEDKLEKITTGWYWQDKYTMHFVIAGVLMGALKVEVAFSPQIKTGMGDAVQPLSRTLSNGLPADVEVRFIAGIRLPTKSIVWIQTRYDHWIDAKYMVEDNARQFLGSMYYAMLNYKAK